MPYICSKCGRQIKSLEMDRVRCLYCRSRIILKSRPKIVRVVKAK